MTTTIKGPFEAVQAVAAIRDKEAGCPHPYSLLIAGKWTNVCPACHEPIKPPWACPKCGWVHADGVPPGVKYQMGLRLADVTVDDKGVATTEVDEAMADKITAAKGKPVASQSKDEKALAAVTVEDKPGPIDEDIKLVEVTK